MVEEEGQRRPKFERSTNPQRGWRSRLIGLSSPARTTTRSRVHYGLQLPYLPLLLPAPGATAVLRNAATRPEPAADAAQLCLLRLGQSAGGRADAGVHDIRLRLRPLYFEPMSPPRVGGPRAL